MRMEYGCRPSFAGVVQHLLHLDRRVIAPFEDRLRRDAYSLSEKSNPEELNYRAR